MDSTSQILKDLKALASAMMTPGGVLETPLSGQYTLRASNRSRPVSSTVEPCLSATSDVPDALTATLLPMQHVDPNSSSQLNISGVASSASKLERANESPQDSETDTSAEFEENEMVAAPSGGCSDQETDGSVCDGVKTIVYFLHSDPERFEQVSRSIWAPEEVEPVEEDECDSDAQPRRLRLPLFPFGGGVSEMEERHLNALYVETVRNMRRRHHESNSATKSKSRSMFVNKDAFDARQFPEALEGDRRSSFAPDSPLDFVTEVDADVLFDAHAAKAERRLKICEALSKNSHDAAMSGIVNLRVIMDPLKTGFEEEKEFPIEPGEIVANRFQIADLLGKATFSRAVRAYDLHQPVRDEEGALVGYAEVCLKIINNSKEFFDQSLDEIRLLQLINSKADPDDVHVIRLIDFFYYKEHTFLVTELLSDNLYEYAQFNRNHEEEFYFTIERLRRIAKQVTEALAYIHSLNLMHCDLKPENILFVSHRRCVVKVIDFGSSCFLSDHLSSYIQSRSYRAPEVILGADYDGRIDVWSLGAILVELVTGEVLFSSETVPEMLARIVSVCGRPFPRSLLWEGRHTQEFFNKVGAIYEVGNKERDENAEDSYFLYLPERAATQSAERDESASLVHQPAFARLREKLRAHMVVDTDFIDFVQKCLTLDHKLRPTSAELLKHPFLAFAEER